MNVHRSLDRRALGVGASLVIAMLVGCATTSKEHASGNDEGGSSDGGRAPSTGSGKAPMGDGGASPGSDGGAAPASVHQIKSFTFAAKDNPGLSTDVVGAIAKGSISLTVPDSTDVSALVPTIDFSGDAVSPPSAQARDFSKPLSYVVTADDGSKGTYTVTVTEAAPPACVGTAATCSTDVYDRAVAFANANPTRPGSHGTWNQYCAALVYWFGGFSASAASADDAYHASTISSTDPTTAPIGAIHYWALGAYGHVGVDLLGGGAVVFMASEHVADHWGTSGYVGVNSVASYAEAAGATYRGWSMEFNGHGQTISGGGACGAATVPTGCSIPKSTTETTGAADAAFIMRLQLFGRGHGYTGPIDGNSNAATWKAAQAALAAYGYSGPVNGLPGNNTYMAFQTLAQDGGGYTGPVNGVLGPNSYRGFATYLNENF